MIYLLVVIILLFLAYAYDIKNCKQKKMGFIFAVILLLVAIAGFSYRIGIDAIRYSEDFIFQPRLTELATFDFSTAREDPLWVIFASIFRTVSSDFLLFHIAHALIINTIIINFIRKETNYVFTAILLYFLSFYIFFNFEVLRESMAVAVFLLSFKSLTQKKWIIYYIYAAIAFLLHSSAIFVFLVPFLLRLQRISMWKVLLSVLALFLFTGRYINDFVLDSLQSIQINERIAYKLTVYLGREGNTISIGALLKNAVIPVVLLMTEYFVFKKESRFTPFTKIFVIIGSISLFIPVADRLLNYLLIFYIIHVTETIFNFLTMVQPFSVRFIIYSLLLIGFTFAPLSWYLTVDDRINEYNYHRYLPYKSYLFKGIHQTREKFYENDS